MSEAAATPAPTGDVAPTKTDAAPTTTPDPKAELNEALKRSGLKLKAKDREYVPRDIDDIVNKAQRAFGLETEIEAVKKEKAEAASIKAWRAAIEADDESAAEQAFEALSPAAQRNAAKWLQKKAASYERERALPPEAQEFKRLAEEQNAKLREYQQKEAEQQRKVQNEQDAAELRSAHESVLKVATAAMAALKVDGQKAPGAARALLPFAARHMRAAEVVAAETGVAVDPAEIAANVQSDFAQAFSAAAEGMPDDALYDTMGEALVKRLLGTHLKRIKGIKPAQSGAPAVNGQQKGEPKRDPRFGTPAFLR